MKLGYSVELVFVITQHSRDRELMESLISYFGCGNIYLHKKESGIILDFRIVKFKYIIEKLIPLFENNPILGVKALDFADFCKVAELMKNKAHLTKEGLDQIHRIKVGMNRGRVVDK